MKLMSIIVFYILPKQELENEDFADTRTNWDADVHLISTYAFLSEDEQRVFKLNEQSYLIKQVYSHTHKNIVGSNIVDIETRGGFQLDVVYPTKRYCFGAVTSGPTIPTGRMIFYHIMLLRQAVR